MVFSFYQQGEGEIEMYIKFEEQVNTNRGNLLYCFNIFLQVWITKNMKSRISIKLERNRRKLRWHHMQSGLHQEGLTFWKAVYGGAEVI